MCHGECLHDAAGRAATHPQPAAEARFAGRLRDARV